MKGAHRATTPLDRGGVQTTLRKVAQDCGLKKDHSAQPASQRYATHLIEAGVDLLEVQKILGHHSILTTARYTGVRQRFHHFRDIRLPAYAIHGLEGVT